MNKDSEKNKTALEHAGEAFRKFWLEKGNAPIIKARHAELFIEPKVFLAGKLNPTISRLIIKEYLSKITLEDIASGRVVITSDHIKIKDKAGKLIAEVKSKKLIDSMMNKITNYLGKALSAKKAKEGLPYVEPAPEGNYAFGDIKDALIQFLDDMEKNDSKNLVRDAVVLLKKGSA